MYFGMLINQLFILKLPFWYAPAQTQYDTSKNSVIFGNFPHAAFFSSGMANRQTGLEFLDLSWRLIEDRQSN